MLAKYSILTDSRKLIPAKCKKFREWTDLQKFLTLRGKATQGRKSEERAKFQEWEKVIRAYY